MDSINTERSYTEYEVTEPTTDFAIGFDNYSGEDKDAIHVTLDGVNLDNLDYTVVRKNAQVIEVTPAIESGVVRLQRETYIDQAFHNYTAGALFSPKSMDENFAQVRHSQQEVNDGFTFLAENTSGVVAAAETATARANAAAEYAESVDAVQFRAELEEQKLDTGITVTPTLAGTIARILSNVLSDRVSIKSFGVLGNGTLADSNRFQAAINVVTGKELFLPSGVYPLDATNVAVNNLSFVGEKGTVITPIATSNLEGQGKRLFYVTGNNVSFTGIRFDLGNGGVIDRGTTYNYPEHAIYAENVDGITIHDCEFNDGVFGFVEVDCTDVRVTFSRFNRLERWGIFLEGGTTMTIAGNTCDGNAYDGIKLSASQNPSRLSLIKDVYIYGNTLTNNLRDGIDFAIDGAESVHIFDNIIKGNKIYGIEVKKSISNTNSLSMQDIHVHDNEIHLPTEAFYGILFRMEGVQPTASYKNCSAYNNRIYGVSASTTNDGIWAGGTDFTNIYDNQIYNVNIGILIGNSTNTVANDNTVYAKKPVVIQGTGTDDNVVVNNTLKASAGHGVSVLTGARNRVSDNTITTTAGFYSVEDETTGTGNSSATGTVVIANVVGSQTSAPTGKGRVGDIMRNPNPVMNTVAEWIAVTNSLTSATWVGTKFVGAITDLNYITLKNANSDLRIEPNSITFNRATSYLDQKIVGGQVAHRIAQVGGALEPVITVKFGGLQLNKVPTSATGLVAGDIWRDGTTLRIV